MSELDGVPSFEDRRFEREVRLLLWHLLTYGSLHILPEDMADPEWHRRAAQEAGRRSRRKYRTWFDCYDCLWLRHVQLTPEQQRNDEARHERWANEVFGGAADANSRRREDRE